MTKKKPLVTVLMSVYNGARWLDEAIESIVKQEFRDFEFLIINDGSEDETPKIMGEWSKRDSRIRCIDKPNTGLTDSLNYGLNLIDSTWVARLDADDISKPDRLRKQMALIKNGADDIVLVGCGLTLIDQTGRRGKSYIYSNDSCSLKRRLIRYRPFFAHSSIMFRTDVAKRIGGYRSRLKRAQDRDLWLRLIEEGKLACVEETLVYIRKHEEQISSGKSGQLQKIDSFMSMVSYWLRAWGYQDPIDDHHSDKAYQEYRRSVIRFMQIYMVLSNDKSISEFPDTMQTVSESWRKYRLVGQIIITGLTKYLIQLIQLLVREKIAFLIAKKVVRQLAIKPKQNCFVKKLIYLSNGIIPSMSANSVHVMKMCNAFSKNIETILIGVASESKSDPFDFYGTTNPFDLKLIKKYKGFLGSLLYLFRILTLVAREKEALFYGRHTIALFLLSKMNHRVAYESHQMPQNRFRCFLEASMFRQKKFLKLVVISQALKKDYLRQFLFLKDEMVVVSHDAADLPMITADKNKNKKIIVGYVGHLYAGRGIELILGMAKRRPSLIFELVGGQKEDVINWKHKSVDLPNVVFRGHIQPKDLHSFYERFDIVLAPYQLGVNQADGKTDTTKWMSPMKIFEYMSFGLPIICSDIPVLREILNKNNAILVSPSNLDAWCAAVDQLQDYRPRKILGGNAYKTVCANHTWEIRAKEILNKVLLEPTNQTSVLKEVGQ